MAHIGVARAPQFRGYVCLCAVSDPRICHTKHVLDAPESSTRGWCIAALAAETCRLTDLQLGAFWQLLKSMKEACLLASASSENRLKA